VTAVNAFSTVVPLIVGATGVMFKLVLDNDAAIKIGKEQAGLDKEKGRLTLPIKPTDRFEVAENGSRRGKVIEGQLRDSFDAEEARAYGAGLAQALEFPAFLHQTRTRFSSGTM